MSGTWNHVQGGGVTFWVNTQRTLTATFASAVAAGDLIVVSGGWYATLSYVYPTVADSVSGVNYNQVATTVTTGTGNIATFWFVVPPGKGGVELHHHGNPAVVRQRV